MGAYHIQKITVVRDRDDRAFVAAQMLLEPIDAIGIEMIRRLIEQED